MGLQGVAETNVPRVRDIIDRTLDDVIACVWPRPAVRRPRGGGALRPRPGRASRPWGSSRAVLAIKPPDRRGPGPAASCTSSPVCLFLTETLSVSCVLTGLATVRLGRSVESRSQSAF